MTAGNRRTQWSHRIDKALLAMLYAIPLTVTWTVAGVHIAIGVGAFLAIVLGILQRRVPLLRTSADAAWIAWGAACLLAAIWAIPEADSWTPMKKVLMIPLAHVTAATVLSGNRARWALRLLVGATAVTALLAAVIFLLKERGPDARLSAWSHYMTFAGQILLVAPAAFCASIATRGRMRWLYTLATVALLIALILTFTRSAWLGSIVAAVFILARMRPRLLWLVPLGVGLLLTVAPESYRARAFSSFDLSHPNNQDRQRMWRAGVEIWRDHPWTGVGLGDLIPVYRQYAPADADQIHGHMHNNFIQVLASRGIVGLLAFVWLLGSFAVLIWRARSSDPETAALLLGVWGSFWGFLTMGLFEWNFGDVEITIPLYFLLGISASLTTSRSGRSGTASDWMVFHEQEGQGRPRPSSGGAS